MQDQLDYHSFNFSICPLLLLSWQRISERHWNRLFSLDIRTDSCRSACSLSYPMNSIWKQKQQHILTDLAIVKSTSSKFNFKSPWFLDSNTKKNRFLNIVICSRLMCNGMLGLDNRNPSCADFFFFLLKCVSTQPCQWL